MLFCIFASLLIEASIPQIVLLIESVFVCDCLVGVLQQTRGGRASDSLAEEKRGQFRR